MEVDKHKLWLIFGIVVALLIIGILFLYPAAKEGFAGQAVKLPTDSCNLENYDYCQIDLVTGSKVFTMDTSGTNYVLKFAGTQQLMKVQLMEFSTFKEEKTFIPANPDYSPKIYTSLGEDKWFILNFVDVNPTAGVARFDMVRYYHHFSSAKVKADGHVAINHNNKIYLYDASSQTVKDITNGVSFAVEVSNEEFPYVTVKDSETGLLKFQPPKPKEVSFYFDNVDESSIEGYPAKMTGNIKVANGVYDGAFVFNGAEKVELIDHKIADVGPMADFSLEAWVLFNKLPIAPYHTLFSKTGKAPNKGYSFSIMDLAHPNEFNVRFSLDGLSKQVTLPFTLELKKWHHFVVSVNRDGLARFYVNGNELGNMDVSSKASMDLTTDIPLVIGQSYELKGAKFKGSIDLPAFRAKALTADEVLTSYQEGIPVGGEPEPEPPAPQPSADDTDGDGLANNIDPCPDLNHPDQMTDTDGDGIGDICDIWDISVAATFKSYDPEKVGEYGRVYFDVDVTVKNELTKDRVDFSEFMDGNLIEKSLTAVLSEGTVSWVSFWNLEEPTNSFNYQFKVNEDFCTDASSPLVEFECGDNYVSGTVDLSAYVEVGECNDDLDNDADGATDCSDKDCKGDVNCPDKDGDLIIDSEDNCPDDINPGQENVDGDKLGDACDSETCAGGYVVGECIYTGQFWLECIMGINKPTLAMPHKGKCVDSDDDGVLDIDECSLNNPSGCNTPSECEGFLHIWENGVCKEDVNVCGDGKLGSQESCDGSLFAISCEEKGFSMGGTPACSNCQASYTSCVKTLHGGTCYLVEGIVGITSSCATGLECIEKPNGQRICDKIEYECANGLDDDNDGKTDCADTDCTNDAACVPEILPTAEEVCKTQCKAHSSYKTCINEESDGEVEIEVCNDMLNTCISECLAPAPEPVYLIGDINGDGCVKDDDLILLNDNFLLNFDKCNLQTIDGDVTGDGCVKDDDLVLLNDNFLLNFDKCAGD